MFGASNLSGQNNNANNNPFAQKPFGSPSPFGAQTGGSIFGGTSTGVFGSSPVFGASSTPAFGSSMPASGFGASSSPAFGGSSAFGQTPAFGGFGSTTQSSPFGNSFQQSQPAFGSNLFGSSPFGASSQSAFGAPSTPSFGSSSTPAFGATSTPAFGTTSTPAFGSTSTPSFGNTGSAFGVSGSSVFGSSTPAFGASSTPAFGASSTSAFGSSSTPAFGASSTPAFGFSPAPAFGAASSPFGFGSSPAFGQSAFGSSPFGTATPAFGEPSSPFGGQATTPAFWSPGFGQSSGQRGPNPAGQSSGGMGFGTNNAQQSSPFPSSSAFSLIPSNPFSSTTSTNPFAPKTSTFSTPGFGNSTPSLGSSPFGTATSNPFASTPTTTPSVFGSAPAFASATSASLFGTPSTSTFGTTSMFGTNQAQGPSFSTGLNFANTQLSPLFQSSTPSLGQTSSPFGQNNFGQGAPAFSAPAFAQSNTFGNMFSSIPSLNTSSMAFNPTTVMHSAFPFINQGLIAGPPSQTTPGNPGSTLPSSASLQSGSLVTPTAPTTHTASGSNISVNGKKQCEIQDVGTSNTPIGYHPHTDSNTYSQIVPTAPSNVISQSSIPSAPPLPDMMDDGPVHYPSIDSDPIDLAENIPDAKSHENEKYNNDSSSCVICLDAPVEGACIPCGHMAGCMSCLNEIKGKSWGCPVCRTKIDQVVRLYAV